MKTKVFGVLVLLLATFSCVKENEQEMQPVNPEDERFAEFDPVVRFGLDTYMGGADDSEPLTKTSYAGENETYVLENVRYERINWNWDPSATEPENKVDTVRIWSKDVFTKNNKLLADYSPWYIPGVTNESGIKDSAADAKILSTDEKDNFYWEISKDPRYFFSVYPTPTGRSTLSVTPPTGTPLEVTVSGIIPRNQKYLKKKVDGNVIEYLPDMSNAYMYAAAKIPSADAGYVKVPLRYKPLFSAVKLKVTAADAGAEKYRLKKVELRTDLFFDDLHQSDPKRVNQPKDGTPLNGDFTAKFGTVPSGDDKKPEYTGDFTVTDYTGKDPAARDTTNKRLTIRIEETDRVWLEGGKEVNVTFLALPIQQEVMTIVYTFEVKDDSGNPKTDDEGNIIEVTRYLALQQKTKKKDNTGEHNEFQERGWFPLPKATKLYVKSNVPEIQYYFDVVMQGNLPRTWKAGSTKPAGKDFFEAKDFYAVISYRDSADVLQPLRWKVTKYKPEGGSWQDAPPSWLNLKGDAPWTAQAPFDVAPVSFTDAWNDNPQGKGTKMKTEVTKNGLVIGYREIDSYPYTYYSAGAPDNGSRSWGWVNHGSYIHSTPDGEFVHHDNDGVAFPDSTGLKGWKGVNGEAYAFDLSSHDIYGKLTAAFNGDPATATTANCYVVSAPGWYRFPAVYGNALKGGIDNDKAYNKGVPNTTNGIMGAFLDHTGNGIENPWITHKYTITSVDIVWDDANRMLSKRYEPADTRILDRRPFCKEIDGKTYIYFYVDDIAQGNALIAAKSGDDIVWSWHIWAVTNPDEYLKTIELQSNQEIPSDPLEYTPLVTFINSKKEIRHNEDLNKARPSCVRNFFWQRADLGQNGKENEVDARYCDVEFSQYFKGKVVQKVVRRVLQSGVKDDFTNAPCYQWGRKDPFQVDFLVKKPIPTNTSVENTDITIKEPTSFFIGENTYFPSGKRYDNLWNTLVDAAVTNSYADGRDGGSKDRNVVKTIYDPSPVGFVVPNMYAFSGLNPFGPISQIRFPYDFADSIADDHINSYKNKKYIDFYSDYDPSETWLRKIDATKTIRLFMTGRIKGSGKVTDADAGQYHVKNGTYYWLSEPGMTEPNHFFGRSLTLDSDNYAAQASGIRVWPVAGTPRYEKVNSSGVGTGTYRDAQGKWQRSHAQPVRPMVEQP